MAGQCVEPNPKDFESMTVIGTGSYGCTTVTLAQHQPTQRYVAIKRINLDRSEVDFSKIQHEVSMHRFLSHPNILPGLCSFVHNKEVWMVSPLAGFGSCRDLIHAHFVQGLPEPAIAYIMREVLQALDYIHRRSVIHRSIKASHLLITSEGQVLVTGLRHSLSMMDTGRRARAVHDFPAQYNNSLLWASPEILEQNLVGYDTKSDIYSLGITACELANGIVPFADIPATQMLLEKIQGVMPRLIDSVTMEDPTVSGTDQGSPNENSPFQRTFSSHFHNFVEMCLKSDPSQRPPASALLQHSFFKHLKRKSQSWSLPGLLAPVQPLTAVEIPRDEPTADMADLTDTLQGASVQDSVWDFG